ncbi:chemotaxis protein CheW [Virgibacillus sp. C22-A2]|uniref:Chemotaxis protein CheW n=1 Tax=Virgibacillus tibetensis TaxID=3042313 RepID=A0ABU6KC66_9BACI|nr:chemotaxis protein CheW [Virgibacillus sp. C22-A2]
MNELIKVIVFQLKDQAYGVEVAQVRSIERIQKITKVPRTSDFIKGVINLHGETTPVIDLKGRLQIAETEPSDDNRILIVAIDGVQVGLIVDSATEVKDIDPSVIEEPPKMLKSIEDAFLKGVAKLEDGLLILLDLEQVLNFNEAIEVKEVVKE